MDSITVSEHNASPFDQMKQVDANGAEYWLATELLKLMGYRTWKRIKDTVERAVGSAQNSGLDISCHFVEVVQMARIGTSQAFREVVKKYWGNVAGAIARVKEAVNEGWCQNPTGLFINSCRSGLKAKNTVNSDVSAWFEWARRERIVLAMSGGVVYTPEGEAVEIEEMMQRYPLKE